MSKSSRKALKFLAFQSGSLILLITTIFIWPLLGKSMSLILFGQLALAISIASILSPILSGGLGISMSYYGRVGNRASHKGLAEIASVWATGLALLTLCYFTFTFFQTESSFLFWVGILSFSGSVLLITSGALRVLDNPIPFFVVTSVTSLSGLTFILTDPNLIGKSDLIFSGFVASAVAALIATYALKALPLPNIHALKFRWGTVLSGSSLLGLHQLFAVSLLLGVRVIVGVLSGATELASFIFCALLVGGGLTLGSTLDGYWSVESQRAKTISQISTFLKQAQAKIQWSLFGLAVVVSCFWMTFRDLWLPAGVNQDQISMAIGFGLPAWGLQAFSDSRSAKLIWQKRRLHVSSSTAISVVVTFSLCFILLPYLGIAAATLSLTLGMLTRYLSLLVLDFHGSLNHLKSSYVAFLLTTAIALIFIAS